MWFWIACLSFAVNMVLLYYVRWLLKTLSVINEDVENVSTLLAGFTQHSQSIYEMEMFYGDETLRSLIDHGKELTEKLQDLDLVINQPEEEGGDEIDQEAA